MKNQNKPLIVDVDGTLLKTDLLLESFLLLLKKNVFFIFCCFFWLLKGRPYLKAQIAERTQGLISAHLLPTNPEVIKLMQEAKADKRQVYIASASHISLLNRVVDAFKLDVDGILGSDESCNLKGHQKAVLLVKQFGEKGFDYIGDSAADLKVWPHAATAYVCGASCCVHKALKKIDVPVVKVASSTPSYPAMSSENAKGHHCTKMKFIHGIIKAMRPHQWSKNLLIFVPLFLAHSLSDTFSLLQAFIAFMAFSLTASSVYILNDLLDLEADRAHKTKKNRPFASGRLSILVGLALFPLLLVVSFALSYHYLPQQFIVILAIYYVVTTLYSFILKHKTLVDVFTLAGLYTLRLFAGAAATHTPLSEWLIAFSIFIFLSLAVVKRYAELNEVDEKSEQKTRGYYVRDLPFLLVLGVGSGLVSVLILTLYAHSDMVRVMYARPESLIFICPIILFWVTRIWMVTFRGKMNADPIVFAMKDKTSYIVVGLLLIVMWSAL